MSSSSSSSSATTATLFRFAKRRVRRLLSPKPILAARHIPYSPARSRMSTERRRVILVSTVLLARRTDRKREGEMLLRFSLPFTFSFTSLDSFAPPLASPSHSFKVMRYRVIRRALRRSAARLRFTFYESPIPSSLPLPILPSFSTNAPNNVSRFPPRFISA